MSNVPPPPPPGYGGTPPPGYGQTGPYGYGSNAREHPDGTTILVLGILGLVLCGVLAPFAWVKGNRAKREIESQPGVYWTNKGNITAGRICGIIGTALIALWLLLIIVVIIAAAASSA